MLKKLLCLLWLSSIAIFTPLANAGLTGDSFQVEWSYYNYFHQADIVTVSPETEFNYSWVSYSYLDLDDSSIEYRASGIYGLGQGLHWRFTNLSGEKITGASVITNFVGWSDSFLTFDSETLDVYFANDVSFTPLEGTIKFNIETIPSAVPEPETYAMMLSGLGLIGFAVRRRKS